MPDLTMLVADPCPTNNAKRAKHSKILKPGCFFVSTPFYQLAYSVLCVLSFLLFLSSFLSSFLLFSLLFERDDVVYWYLIQ